MTLLILANNNPVFDIRTTFNSRSDLDGCKVGFLVNVDFRILIYDFLASK